MGSAFLPEFQEEALHRSCLAADARIFSPLGMKNRPIVRTCSLIYVCPSTCRWKWWLVVRQKSPSSRRNQSLIPSFLTACPFLPPATPFLPPTKGNIACQNRNWYFFHPRSPTVLLFWKIFIYIRMSFMTSCLVDERCCRYNGKINY